MKLTLSDFEQYYIQLIAELIAYMEGWYDHQVTIPRTHNNPGDLRHWGHYPVREGYVQFPSPLAGWNALFEQIFLNIRRDLTLREFFQGKPGVYAGYDKTNSGYPEFVSEYSKIPVDNITIAAYIREIADEYGVDD